MLCCIPCLCPRGLWTRRISTWCNCREGPQSRAEDSSFSSSLGSELVEEHPRRVRCSFQRRLDANDNSGALRLLEAARPDGRRLCGDRPRPPSLRFLISRSWHVLVDDHLVEPVYDAHCSRRHLSSRCKRFLLAARGCHVLKQWRGACDRARASSARATAQLRGVTVSSIPDAMVQ